MKRLIPEILLTMDGKPNALLNHAVVIDGEWVIAVGPEPDLKTQYPEAEAIALPGQVLMPGLINMHSHAAMNLLRGIADDLPLHEWLQNAIWPLEGALADEAFVYDGSILAGAEMLLGGTTTFNDMYFYPNKTIEAALGLGIRVVAGLTIIEFPTRYANFTEEYFSKGLSVFDAFKHEPTVHFTMAPHAPYTVSDDTFIRAKNLCETLDIPMHVHVHETASEVADAVARTGIRPFARLQQLGLVNERLLLVHGVHLNEEELEAMAKAGSTLVHCPASNLKLASGIAPIAQALACGVRVCIGTDGAASNNKIDLWEEARLASLLCKGAAQDARTMNAWKTLQAVTTDAAAALGLSDHIGRIKPGLKADLISLTLGDAPHRVPHPMVNSRLAYAGSARDVQHVWVNGHQVVQAQQLVGHRAQLAQEIVRKSQGVWHTRIEQVRLTALAQPK